MTRARLPGLREVLLALFFVACLSPVVDFDVWLHLAAGRQMWESGQVLSTDVFSHTVPGKSWVYHEWLAAAISWGLYRLGGINMLVLFKAAMMTASMGLLLATFQLRGHGRGGGAVCALLAAMIASRNVALERPHLFTILFLTAYVYWLERQRWAGRPLPWAMAAVAAFWANVHGGFVLGLLAFGPFLVEDGWRYLQGGDDGRAARSRIVRSLGVLAACVGATLLNPYGVETLLYPLQYANPSPFLRQIQEWASPDFQKQFVLEAVLLALVGAGLVSRRAVGLSDGIFALASAHLILTGVRNTFLVGPFLAPGAVGHLDEYFHAPGLRERLGRKLGRLDAGFPGVLLALTVLAGSAWVLTAPPRIAPRLFPAGAVEWMKRERPPGNLFNDYDFGGYLMFNLPEYPVFVDGRVDVYTKHGAFEDFLEVWRLAPGWQAVLDRRAVRVVLVEQRQALAALLGASPRWREAFKDDVAVVYVKRTTEL